MASANVPGAASLSSSLFLRFMSSVGSFRRSKVKLKEGQVDQVMNDLAMCHREDLTRTYT